jgi:hypothetical protein
MIAEGCASDAEYRIATVSNQLPALSFQVISAGVQVSGFP